MREWLREQIKVLLQFLLCTAVLAAVGEWRVPRFVQFAALGGLLLCFWSLLDERSRDWIQSLGRPFALLRELGARFSLHVKLALMLNAPALRLPELGVASPSAAEPEGAGETASEGSVFLARELSDTFEVPGDEPWRPLYERSQEFELVPLEVQPGKLVNLRVRSS